MDAPKFEIISGATLGEPNLYALSTKDHRVLLDAGTEYSGLADACFVSHAHLDHAIDVEKILSNFADQARKASRSTTSPVLMSSNTKVSLSQNGIQTDTASLFKFHTKYEFGDISVTPLPSGHLSGSAMFLIEAHEKTILYTADFCLHEIEGVEPIHYPDRNIDLLVCESSLSNLRIEDDDLLRNQEKIKTLADEDGPTLIVCRRVGDLSRIEKLAPHFLKHENCGGTLRHPDAVDYLKTAAKIIVAGNLANSSASNELASRMLSNPNARIILVNGVQRSKDGIKLIKFARRSRVKWGGYEGRLRAHLFGISLRNHPTREEVIDFTKSVGPKRVAIVLGPDSGRYAIAKKLSKLGYDTLVPTSGDMIET
jgi:Cft2 family RNA processing exonuclease